MHAYVVNTEWREREAMSNYKPTLNVKHTRYIVKHHVIACLFECCWFVSHSSLFNGSVAMSFITLLYSHVQVQMSIGENVMKIQKGQMQNLQRHVKIPPIPKGHMPIVFPFLDLCPSRRTAVSL